MLAVTVDRNVHGVVNFHRGTPSHMEGSEQEFPGHRAIQKIQDMVAECCMPDGGIRV
jgi:hypothetical protein